MATKRNGYKINGVNYRVDDTVFVAVSDDIFGDACITDIHIDINCCGDTDVKYDIEFLNPDKNIDGFNNTWRVKESLIFDDEVMFDNAHPIWPPVNSIPDFKTAINLDKQFESQMKQDHKYAIGTVVYYIRENKGKQATIERFIDDIHFDNDSGALKKITTYVVRNYEDNKLYQMNEDEIYTSKEDLVNFLFKNF